MTPYEDLKTRFARIGHLDDVLGLLQWDQETVMPDGAAPRRADVVGTVSMLRHRLITDPPVGDLLDAAEAAAAGNGGLGPWDRANLREMRRLWTHAAAVPGDLVEANARATSLCETAWRTARRDSDFNALLPTLGELLTLQRRIGEAKADSLGVSAYDALLDMYEPDGRAARIDALFDDLAGFLPGFTEEVLAHQARRPAVARPPGPFPEAAQRPLALALMTAAGFDFRHGRLDTSAHPFCTGADSDVRITTRYEEDDFSRAILGTLHETGHALYEQGRPAEWRGQPVGEARGMALHESQSLVIEMQACRSREFIDYLAPLVREAFGGSGEAWSDDNLYRMYTRVERSLIRVDADEVTYPAHVILRYRLERAMLAGGGARCAPGPRPRAAGGGGAGQHPVLCSQPAPSRVSEKGGYPILNGYGAQYLGIATAGQYRTRCKFCKPLLKADGTQLIGFATVWTLPSHRNHLICRHYHTVVWEADGGEKV